MNTTASFEQVVWTGQPVTTQPDQLFDYQGHMQAQSVNWYTPKRYMILRSEEAIYDFVAESEQSDFDLFLCQVLKIADFREYVYVCAIVYLLLNV